MVNKKQHIVSLPCEGYVRLSVILSVYPVSRSTFLAGVKTGRYPKPVKLGPRTTAWRVDDIRQLLNWNEESQV